MTRSSNLRIDPDFVVPDPTAANMFGFCELDEFGDDEMKRQGDWMREAGAKQMRLTIVSDEYPNPPYPNGYYFEGWTDENARQLPFAESVPLAASGMEAGTDETPQEVRLGGQEPERVEGVRAQWIRNWV